MKERLEPGSADQKMEKPVNEAKALLSEKTGKLTEVLQRFPGAFNVVPSKIAFLALDLEDEEIENRFKKLEERVDEEYQVGKRTEKIIYSEDILWTLKPELFDLKKKLLMEQRSHTSLHEMGHAVVANLNGWKTPFVSVIPKENYLGVTYSLPPGNRSEWDLFYESIAIAYGGYDAEEMCGIKNHRGCSYDLAMAKRQAHFLSYYIERFYGVNVSPEEIEKKGEDLSWRALKRFGESKLRRESSVLFEKGVLT